MNQQIEIDVPEYQIPRCELSQDDERLAVTNTIQRTLWRRMGRSETTTDPQPLNFIDWITRYSKSVREFYDAHMETEFFVGWPGSDDDSADEKKLLAIEAYIYQ